MGKYPPLNFANRLDLEALHWEYGRYQEKLAWKLGGHRPTVYRELRRRSTSPAERLMLTMGYRADSGEKRKRIAARRKGRRRKVVQGACRF